ncbi:MAG: electron transfer flavoprotein subunit alpha/FixB family protein [Thermoplasmata archaeon]|nr:electron transfer flavoprotein subunit alpha/FixB family protein [Thermoplasmata archaeon]
MVLIYSNNKKLTLEMIAKGRELADEQDGEVIVAMIDEKDENLANEYISHGADKVFLVESGVENFKAEEYTDIMANMVNDVESGPVLIGSNKYGKELASRLAAKLSTGCVIDCTDIYMEDGELTVERMVYNGNAISVERFSGRPGIITVPSKLFDPLKKDEGRSGEVIEKSYDVSSSYSNIAGIEEMPSEGVDVEAANIIVSCGRGFKNREDLHLAEELADALKGKVIGCSRPISADLKWLSEDHWIGLSGHKVKPSLYFAIGISGQIQHIAGIRDSGIIVAINKDPNALIFDSADYGIVGDLYEVLPKLTDAIKKEMD